MKAILVWVTILGDVRVARHTIIEPYPSIWALHCRVPRASSLPACKRTLTYLQAAQSGLRAEQGETKRKSERGAKFRFPTNGIH